MKPHLFVDLVREEVDSARKKQNRIKLEDGCGLILLKLERTYAEMLKVPTERNDEVMWENLIDIAAISQRTAEDNFGRPQPEEFPS